MRLTYCTVADVNSRATDESQTAWSALSDTHKNEIIFRATDDIVAFHGMPSSGGQLWGFQYLREAAESRCLFLARVRGLRDVKERAEYLGADSLNDGILSMSGLSDKGLDKVSAALVTGVMKQYGYAEEFCRG